MNDISLAHVHLMLVHVPVIGIPIGLILLCYGLMKTSSQIRGIALALIAVTAVAAIPAYLTGESAEEVVENRAGVSENTIEAHEEAAELTFVIVQILGAISIISLIAGGRLVPLKQWTDRSVLLFAIIASLLLVRTANLGGRIGHPEVFGTTKAELGYSDDNESEKQDDEENE